MDVKFKLNGRMMDLIGSPSFPSPLDRIRTGRRERAAQFGLNIENEESFEGNQSFPRLNPKPKIDYLSPEFKLRGNELNSISFLPTFKKAFRKADNKQQHIKSTMSSFSHNYTHNDCLDNSTGFDKSWQFYNYFANSDAIAFNMTQQNVLAKHHPNKALVTISGRNSEILTANDIACELFGYREEELIGKRLRDLLDANYHHKHDIIMESHLDDGGNLILCSGKIFDACDSNGVVIPISMYMQRLNYTDNSSHDEPKCLCAIEPVQRIVGNFTINLKGRIREFNEKFLAIFGYIGNNLMIMGKEVYELIPSLKLPSISGITSDVKKQTCTGRTINGVIIPLTIRILNKQLLNDEIVFNCSASFYTNISGLLTVGLDDGLIYSYNSTFAHILFGYDEQSLKRMPITALIPNFYDNKTSSNKSRRHYEEEDEDDVDNALNRSLTYDDIDIPKRLKYMSNDDLKSFNSNSIDSSNLSSFNKSSISTFNSSANENSQSVKDITEDSESETAKYCTYCGCELTYHRQSNQILDQMILNTQTSANKCASFIQKHDFNASICSNSNSSSVNLNLNQSTSSLLTNNDSVIQSSDLTQSRLLNISDYDSKYVCEDCIEKINSGKSILPLNEINTNKISKSSNLDSSTSTTQNDHDNNNDNNDELTNNNDQSSVSLVAMDSEENMDSDEIENDINKKKLLKMPSINANLSKHLTNKTQITSTPAPNEDRLISTIYSQQLLQSQQQQKQNQQQNCSQLNKTNNVTEGTFYGSGKHRDGSLIQIIYQRKLVELSKEKKLVCVWICKDPDTDKSMLETSYDMSQLKRSVLANESLSAQTSQYLLEYEDINTLGRGASGFVQFAKRKQDSFEVVTKYIRKSKIHKDSWIEDEHYGRIPLEISILCKLDHTNIIKVLEIFQDNDYIQMVMEKHGCGMDLFEFIDRQPSIDEPLASYIFRQLVSAVSYLHSNNIVHRDIKDENIVINEKFHIKLIDFGSAAYMVKGKKFATFCGTLEYCSPEVLLGNKYYGPELDCWTIGIALYTLIFAENPFFDADETIECILKPPFKVSKELMKLLFSILYPKPELRATIKDIETNEWVTQPVEINNYKWENVVKNTEFHANNAGDCRRDDSESINASENNHIDVDLQSNNKTNGNNNQSINENDQEMIVVNYNNNNQNNDSNIIIASSLSPHSKSF